MSTNYVTPPAEVSDLVNDTIAQHHERLLALEIPVTVGVLMVWGDIDEEGQLTSSTLKHHGVPAAAITKINNLKLRAYGLPDAEILIDQFVWDFASNEARVALIDHELTHIELVYKDNTIVLDDLGRPKLRTRTHDWHFGWFDEVVERHGKHSFESVQAQQFYKQSGQLFLDI